MKRILSIVVVSAVLGACGNQKTETTTTTVERDTTLVVAPVKKDTVESILHDSTGTNTKGRPISTDTARTQR